MGIKFNERTLHERIEFMPGVTYGFEDPDAESYFKGAGWAVDSAEPVQRTYAQEECSVDLETRHNDSGLTVGEIVNAGFDIDKAKAARTADAQAEAAKEAGKLKVQPVKAPSEIKDA